MAKGYLTVDRDQPFLLPPDVREWLPREHLAWYVLDAVAALDTSGFHASRRLGGVGRRGYDPDMLLALLVYCYSQSVRSSRRIEQLCVQDVACRVICGNRVPDHTAIARFRADNEQAVKAFFTDVVAVAVQAGAARVGTLAIDGTKIAADASRSANKTRQAIAAQIDAVVAEAAAVDAAEDAELGQARGDELPASLAEPDGRVQRLQRCLADLDAEAAAAVATDATGQRLADAREHLEATRAKQQAKVDAFGQAWREGRPWGRKPPVAVEQASQTRRARQRVAAAEAAHAKAVQRAEQTNSGQPRRRNTTDPDSLTLWSNRGWVQGYNAQAAFDENGIALAAELADTAADVASLHPLIDQSQRHLDAAGARDRIDAVVADTGYWSHDNVAGAFPTSDTTDDCDTPEGARTTTAGNDQADPPGHPDAQGHTGDADDQHPTSPHDDDHRRSPPLLLIPPKGSLPHHRTPPPGQHPPGDDASPADKMRQLLATPHGRQTYAKRSPQAEGPFGHIKTSLGFTRFARRGRSAADAEWRFILAVRNLVLLHQRQTALPPA